MLFFKKILKNVTIYVRVTDREDPVDYSIYSLDLKIVTLEKLNFYVSLQKQYPSYLIHRYLKTNSWNPSFIALATKSWISPNISTYITHSAREYNADNKRYNRQKVNRFLLTGIQTKLSICPGEVGTYPFLFGEEAETDAETGAGLAGQLIDFLHFLHYGRWKPWGDKHKHTNEGPFAQSNEWNEVKQDP